MRITALPLAATAMAALPLLSACTSVEDDTEIAPTAFDPPVRIVGEGQNCIPRSQIRQTRVRNDQVIDFEMRGGDVYRNVLASSCPRLGFEEAFTYNTTINQLCSVEIIYVLEQIGGQVRRGAGCSLGEFVPVKYVEEEDD